MALTVIPREPAFDGQIACQRFYRRLAGGIERMAGQPFAGTHRGGADQPSSTTHVSCGLLHGKELTARIDGQHMVEVLHTHLVKGCEVLNAGVTRQDIELAILLKRLPHQALDVRDIARICLNGQGLTASLPARAGDLIFFLQSVSRGSLLQLFLASVGRNEQGGQPPERADSQEDGRDVIVDGFDPDRVGIGIAGANDAEHDGPNNGNYGQHGDDHLPPMRTGALTRCALMGAQKLHTTHQQEHDGKAMTQGGDGPDPEGIERSGKIARNPSPASHHDQDGRRLVFEQ